MRSALAIVAACALAACGGPAPAAAPTERTFHLEPLTDLVVSPRLAWLVQASPRALYALPSLAVALEEVMPSARLGAFSATHGGLDPRALHEIAWASYEPAPGHEAGVLWLGRGFLPATRIEAAELRATPYVRQHARDPSGLVRIEGRADNRTLELLLFGHQGIVQADGAPVPAKAARAFAEERLKKTQPALRVGALREAELAAGAAPLRAFAARPDVSFARDGLFEHFEAIAVALTPSEVQGVLWFSVRVVGVGPFAGRESAVESAVGARLARIEGSRVGALFGLSSAPPWTFRTAGRVLVAERRVQGAPLLHGLHLATEADTAELFAAP